MRLGKFLVMNEADSLISLAVSVCIQFKRHRLHIIPKCSKDNMGSIFCGSNWEEVHLPHANADRVCMLRHTFIAGNE